jgi:alpha-ribazole phosphatase
MFRNYYFAIVHCFASLMIKQVDIYFLRHTEPLIEAGTCYGQLDCDVTGDYCQQLAKINKYFKEIDIDVIYSSPLLRCAKLAEDIAKTKKMLPVNYLDALKEIHFGDWEGQKWDDIPRHKIDEWNNNRLHFEFPNGESPWKFTQRVLGAYSKIMIDLQCLDSQKTTLLVVIHAGVIRTMLANILSLTVSESLNIHLDKPSISLCSFKNEQLDSYQVNFEITEITPINFFSSK